MNRKIILTFIVVAVVALLGIGSFLLWGKADTELIKAANYQGAMLKEKNGSKITLTTGSGTVSINNIFKKDKTSFNKAGDPEVTNIVKTAKFTFDYYYDGDYFAAYLLQKPVQEARDQAEAAILQTLGISKEDACKLTNLVLYIPTSVDKNIGADEHLNYGLSWCPEAYIIE